jgi:rod shape-determining protein MreD
LKAPLFIPFAIACFFALFNSALIPQVKLLVFSPFLAILYNRCSFQACLGIACLCGFMIDLFSTDLRLGIHALNYCLVTGVLYKQRRHFFEDKPLAICLFTGLISTVSTIIQWLLISLCGKPFILSKELLATDLIFMPVIDMVYAFTCSCCPLILYSHIRKVGWRVFYETTLHYLHLKKSTGTHDSD